MKVMFKAYNILLTVVPVHAWIDFVCKSCLKHVVYFSLLQAHTVCNFSESTQHFVMYSALNVCNAIACFVPPLFASWFIFYLAGELILRPSVILLVVKLSFHFYGALPPLCVQLVYLTLSGLQPDFSSYA